MHFLQLSIHFRKCAADHWSLRNFLPRSSLFMVGKAQKLHGARSGLYGGCSNGVPPIHLFQVESRIKFRSHPMRFVGFFNHEKGAPRQEISKWSTVYSTFWRSGWSVVRNASLAKGGTSTKRPSPHLHKFSTRSNKVSPLTFQTALVYWNRLWHPFSIYLPHRSLSRLINYAYCSYVLLTQQPENDIIRFLKYDFA
jgi:hypothetical protein